ncbi:hypothetical protein DIPPA_08724 [Diplonema papillatum]|nr:hypothetical protein DIPPA_08724 [Diplonema papillatum]
MGKKDADTEDDIEMELMDDNDDDDDDDDEDEEEDEEDEESSAASALGTANVSKYVGLLLREISWSKAALMVCLLAIAVTFVACVPCTLLFNAYDQVQLYEAGDVHLHNSLTALSQQNMFAELGFAHLNYAWQLTEADESTYQQAKASLLASLAASGTALNASAAQAATLSSRANQTVASWLVSADAFVARGKALAALEEAEAAAVQLALTLPKVNVLRRIEAACHAQLDSAARHPAGTDTADAAKRSFAAAAAEAMSHAPLAGQAAADAMLYGGGGARKEAMVSSYAVMDALLGSLAGESALLATAEPAFPFVFTTASIEGWQATLAAERAVLASIVDQRDPLVTDAFAAFMDDVLSDVEHLSSPAAAPLATTSNGSSSGSPFSEIAEFELSLFRGRAAEAGRLAGNPSLPAGVRVVVPVLVALFALSGVFFFALPTARSLSPGVFGVGCLLTVAAVAGTAGILNGIAERASDDEQDYAQRLAAMHTSAAATITSANTWTECFVKIDRHLGLGTQQSKIEYEDCLQALGSRLGFSPHALKSAADEMAGMKARAHGRPRALQQLLGMVRTAVSGARPAIEGKTALLHEQMRAAAGDDPGVSRALAWLRVSAAEVTNEILNRLLAYRGPQFSADIDELTQGHARSERELKDLFAAACGDAEAAETLLGALEALQRDVARFWAGLRGLLGERAALDAAAPMLDILRQYRGSRYNVTRLRNQHEAVVGHQSKLLPATVRSLQQRKRGDVQHLRYGIAWITVVAALAVVLFWMLVWHALYDDAINEYLTHATWLIDDCHDSADEEETVRL